MNATTNPAAWLPVEHGEHPVMDIIPASRKDMCPRNAVVPTQETVIANPAVKPKPMEIGATAALEMEWDQGIVPVPVAPCAMPIIHGRVIMHSSAMIPEPNGAKPRAMLLRAQAADIAPIIAPAAEKRMYVGIIFARAQKTQSVAPKTAMKSICAETTCANILEEKHPQAVPKTVNLKPPKNAGITFVNTF
mgnify:CR=1 FL=1